MTTGTPASTDHPGPLTLGHKLNRMFAYFHNAIEDELGSDAAALIVGQKLRRHISPATIDQARAGEAALPADVCRELCVLMDVPVFYLEMSPDVRTDELIRHEDARLHLWATARDRGVQSLIARGANDDDVAAILAAVEQMPVVAQTARRQHHLEVVATSS